MIRAYGHNGDAEPRAFWAVGLHFFERINHSNFSRSLIPYLAEWQRTGWNRIVRAESFRLHRPRQTVPAIEEVLAMPTNDGRFVARLLLASSEAIGSPLGVTSRDRLKVMSELVPLSREAQ